MPRNGSGAQCQKCPVNTFNDVYSSGECHPCPAGSKSPEGSTSQSSCICEVGVLDTATGSLAWFQPCQLGKEMCLAMFGHVFPQKNCLIFPEWWSCEVVFKSLVLKQSSQPLGQSKEVRMSKGRSQVLGHLREMPGAVPELLETRSRSPLGQSLAKLHPLGQREPRIQMLEAGKQMQCQPLRPFEPSQGGIQYEGFCCQCIDVFMFRCFMDIV